MPSPNIQTFGIVTVTDAAFTVTDDAHAGVRVIMNRAAGCTATLPAATGSGARYEFIGAVDASGSQVIQVANSTDVMSGVAMTDMTGVLFATAADSDTITLNATTSGGYKGWRVICDDIASGNWAVLVISEASGTEVTPFSANV